MVNGMAVELSKKVHFMDSGNIRTIQTFLAIYQNHWCLFRWKSGGISMVQQWYSTEEQDNGLTFLIQIGCKDVFSNEMISVL